MGARQRHAPLEAGGIVVGNTIEHEAAPLPSHLPEMRHEVLDGGEASEGVWIYRMDLDPEDESETMAVLVEALRPAVWGGQVLANLRNP